MESISDSFGALLLIQARPIENGKDKNNSNGYNEFSTKIKRLSLSPPFKSDAYEGCLWNTTGKNISQENCSKYYSSVNIIQLLP